MSKRKLELTSAEGSSMRTTGLVKKKTTRVINLYIKPEHDEKYEKIREILIREGGSLSDMVWRAIGDYVNKHYHKYNPQKSLLFAEKPLSMPLWATCRYGADETVRNQFYCSLNRPRYGHSASLYSVNVCDSCKWYVQKVGDA